MRSFPVRLLCLFFGLALGAGCAIDPDSVPPPPPSPGIIPKAHLPAESITPQAHGGAARGLPGRDAAGAPPDEYGDEDRLEALRAAEERDMEFIRSASVYFYFDDAALTEEAKEVLRQKAALLRANAGFFLTLTGHADDRGSAVYNMALGERRARAALGFLLSQGVSATRLRALSLGKSAPTLPGADESARSVNRRVEFSVSRLDDGAKAP